MSHLIRNEAVVEGELIPTRAAVALVQLGISVDKAAALLSWREFEELCGEILEENGYSPVLNLRFKSEGRRYEIDAAGISPNLVMLIDCKMWSARPGKASALTDAAKKQKMRVRAFAAAIQGVPRIRLRRGTASLVPVVVTWLPGGVGIREGVPIVPLYVFNSFVVEFDRLDEGIWTETVNWSISAVRQSSLS